MQSFEPDHVPSTGKAPRAWWRELTRYQWLVLLVAALGWMFDTMDQQLFNLARKPAITELLQAAPDDVRVDQFGSYSTTIFILGWASGGLAFGILGDRIGRVKTMILTIGVYSMFTGLSALAVSVWDFCFFRFLTGLGVGGEFAVGVALVAEVMPDRARPHALGWLQALSAIGNITAALINIGLGALQGLDFWGSEWKPWRIMFLLGALPAALTILIQRRLKEPERWRAAVSGVGVKYQPGSLKELFGTPRWRRNALVGMTLAFAGVVGLWGIGFFSFDFARAVFRKTYEAQGLSDQLVDARLTRMVGVVSLLQNFGGFLGVYAFSRVTHHTGRKPAFALGFLLALGSTAYTFWFLSSFWDVFWMIPMMGFCQLTLFGGYAIYFPELFPTRLRSTGTSFCYNVGRFVAAIGPLTMGLLIKDVFGGYGQVMAWRYTGVTMCVFFLCGLAVLPFAPETRGQPLPE
jgi:MFS family permease